jgi:hypothetical protein
VNNRYSRRKILAQTASLAGVGVLAGCSGDGGSDGSGGETATPELTVSGPGGDATMELSISQPSTSITEDFNELSMDFQRIVFETEGGDTAEITVGKTVDFTTISGKQTVAEGVGFPTGTYATARVTMPVATAELSDGSEANIDISEPIEIDLEIVDELLAVESGDTVVFDLIPSVTEFDGEYSIGFGHSRR